MTINLIEQVRADINKYFDSNALIPNMEEIHYSPDKKYFFKSNYYDHSGKNWSWIVSKIEVFQTEGEIKIFEFIRNDDSPFHCWLRIDDKSYLLLSEDVEGKSILDLTDKKFYSYSFEDDKFIWCEYYPSPDCKKLAVIGCHWACPDEIRVFDISEPTKYPFKELYKKDTFQEKIDWVDNETLRITSQDNEFQNVAIL